MNNKTTDILIVGGGVIGLSLAYELALSHLKVTLLERGQVGQESSFAGAGILAPLAEMEEAGPLAQLMLASRKIYPDFVRGVSSRASMSVEFNVSGLLHVALTEAEHQELQRRRERFSSLGLEVQQCSRDETLQRESGLNQELLSALYFPEEGYVDNRELVEALRIACLRFGVKMVSGCQVTAVNVEGERTVGVESNLGRWLAGSTVIAAGCWSGQIDTGLGYPLPVKPARGQLVAVKTPSPVLQHVIYCSQYYLVPRRDGRTLLGSTVEWVGYDKRVTLEAIQRITSAAVAMAPVLADAAFLDCWAGLRPYCEGGLPVLGSAESAGLYFATGHFRNGLLLAPITAKLMCEVIISGAIPKLIEPFGCGRFRAL